MEKTSKLVFKEGSTREISAEAEAEGVIWVLVTAAHTTEVKQPRLLTL